MKKITKFIVSDRLAKANGFEIKDLHSSKGDTEGLVSLMNLLKKKIQIYLDNHLVLQIKRMF